jgi:crossover junction endodeoxyribonuclease RuvC
VTIKRQRLVGFDPGLRKTGWGIIDVEGSRLSHVANGIIRTDNNLSLADRLVQLFDGLGQVITDWEPHSAAVEETFVNKNPNSTLKLGQARGISLLVPAMAGLSVSEYSPNHIKKSVVGSGHAGKEQVTAMLGILLPGVKINGEDAGDALAVAICHAHSGGAHGRLSDAIARSGFTSGAQIIMKGTGR